MRDVRMRGFAERADVTDVESFLRAEASVLSAEAVDLLDCTGRVLAEDVISDVNVPGFPRSAMDGYAIRGEESFGASESAPISFEMIGTSLPGAAFGGTLGESQAVRIMTGAPLPEGADAVVMAEVCQENPDGGGGGVLDLSTMRYTSGGPVPALPAPRRDGGVSGRRTPSASAGAHSRVAPG